MSNESENWCFGWSFWFVESLFGFLKKPYLPTMGEVRAVVVLTDQRSLCVV